MCSYWTKPGIYGMMAAHADDNACKEKDMIRTGIVKEKRGDRLRVCFERPSSCEGCRGCAKGRSRRELITVFGQAEIDDIVDVRMPDGQVFKASVLAYALPLCGLLAGLLLGFYLGVRDFIAVLTGFAGLAACYGLQHLIELKLREHGKWRPMVVASRSAAEDAPVPNRHARNEPTHSNTEKE